MIENLQVYKCEMCGNIVEVLSGGGPVTECCGQPMDLMVENTVDAAREKHVPVVEKVEGGVKVKLGEVPHPMIKEHYIQWIELIADDYTHIKFLKPGDEPEACFSVAGETVTARAYCNLHGLWKK
jgi:superoxide reductase